MGEIGFMRKDGTVCICETMASPIYDGDGHIAGRIDVSREITARKDAQERLASERLHGRSARCPPRSK